MDAVHPFICPSPKLEVGDFSNEIQGTFSLVYFHEVLLGLRLVIVCSGGEVGSKILTACSHGKKLSLCLLFCRFQGNRNRCD